MPGSAVIPKDVKVFRFHDPSDTCQHRKTSEVTLPRGLRKLRGSGMCWFTHIDGKRRFPYRTVTGTPAGVPREIHHEDDAGFQLMEGMAQVQCVCSRTVCLSLGVVLLDKDAVKDVS